MNWRVKVVWQDQEWDYVYGANSMAHALQQAISRVMQESGIRPTTLVDEAEFTVRRARSTAG
jgi:hypothetical protein